MAYYNWGEQIGNNFMSMLAYNQQKKLDEQRMTMEEKRLQDQLATGELQRKTYQNDLDAYDRRQNFYKQMGNPLVVVGDANKDGTINEQDKTPVPWEFMEEVLPSAYEKYPVLTFNTETNQYEETPKWLQNRNADNRLLLAGQNADRRYNVFADERNRALQRMQINATGAGTSLLRRKFIAEQTNELEAEVQKIIDNKPVNWNTNPYYADEVAQTIKYLKTKYPDINAGDIEYMFEIWEPSSGAPSDENNEYILENDLNSKNVISGQSYNTLLEKDRAGEEPTLEEIRARLLYDQINGIGAYQ